MNNIIRFNSSDNVNIEKSKLNSCKFASKNLAAGESFTLTNSANAEQLFVLISGSSEMEYKDKTYLLNRESFLVDALVGFFSIGSSEFQITSKEDNTHIVFVNSLILRDDNITHFELFGSKQNEIVRGVSGYMRTIRTIKLKINPEHLVFGETIANDGNWSSYPPHKHDEYVEGKESVHEEFYVHRFSKPCGWGMQRIYDYKNNVDEAYTIKDMDITILPFGYHPVVVAPGYKHYYLWVLSGKQNSLMMNDDPKFEWIKEIEAKDKKNPVKIINKASPVSCTGDHQFLWKRAKGFYVYDEDDSPYIDFSSGVLITNIGHSNKLIQESLKNEIDRGLLTSYLFPNQAKANFIDELQKYTPDKLDGVALFSTGSEAVEASLRVSLRQGKQKQKKMISFKNAFHGRTMGAQLLGGITSQKDWIPLVHDQNFIQVSYPDLIHNKDNNFENFLKELKEQNVENDEVAAVIIEPYQGGNVVLAPKEFVVKLRKWSKKNNILLIIDEVQSGFGRTGQFWGFEHFEIVPDMIVCGKGINSSLPLSALITKKEFLDAFGECELSSTHSGNNLACAAGYANLIVLSRDKLIENARLIESIIKINLDNLISKYSEFFQYFDGIGGVFALVVTEKYGNKFAKLIVKFALEERVIFFNPVGPGGKTLKICPPLSIDEIALTKAFKSLDDAIEKAITVYRSECE